MFWFDEFLEPVVIVSHTRKNYFDWALSDWAIKANVWVLTFGPLCIYENVYEVEMVAIQSNDSFGICSRQLHIIPREEVMMSVSWRLIWNRHDISNDGTQP